MVIDGLTGCLVAPGDPRALADAVGTLLDDQVLAASLASAGAVDARSRFSFDGYAKALVAAIERAVPPVDPELALPGPRRLTALAVLTDQGVVGGLEASLAHLADDLSMQGVDLRAAVLARPGDDVPAADFLAARLPVVRAPGARTLWRAIRGADVVHVHAPTALSWPVFTLGLARAARKPILLTIHLPGYPLRRPRRIGRVRMGTRFAARGLVLRALGVYVRCPSASAASLARRRFLPVPLAVGVLANGTPDTGWIPVDTAPGSLRALFVGRLEQRKRPDLFVEAVVSANRLGADVQGLIVGDGPERAEVVRLVEARGAPIRLLGAVADVSPLMADSDLLVLPSHAEGAPLVVVEAAARGRASLVRASLEGMDAWQGAFAAVPDAGGAAAFGAALACLATDRQELRRLGAAARARFEDGFTSAIAASRLRDLYEAVSER